MARRADSRKTPTRARPKRRPTPRSRPAASAGERPRTERTAPPGLPDDPEPSREELVDAEGAEPALMDDGIVDPMEADGVLVEPEGALLELEGEEEAGASVDVSRSAAMMSGLVIVSRITGFLRTSRR